MISVTYGNSQNMRIARGIFYFHVNYFIQGLVKGAILCFRNLNFYFQHGESTSTASQLTSPASQKSKDLNKVPLLLQDLDYDPV